MRREEVKIKNQRWDEKAFLKEREKVLARWKTGQEVDLEEAVLYLKKLPSYKLEAVQVRKAKEEGTALAQPRAGMGLVEEMIALLRILQEEGTTDILPVTTDSYTRNERFQEAQNAIEKSQESGKSLLNGFPVVNHGLKGCRKLQEALHNPLQAFGGTAHPCLIAEIAFASGITGFLGSPLSYVVAYSKHTSIEQAIHNYQYIDRLTSFYAERGIELHREAPGFLTATTIPSGLCIAFSVIESLLAAEQGLKYFGAALHAGLNVPYGVAGIRALPELCQEYLTRFGYQDVFVPITGHQWRQIPTDQGRAYAVICLGTTISVLAGVQLITLRTVDEALGIPRPENNAAAVRTTKEIIEHVGTSRYPESGEMIEEKEMIKKEARAIIDKVLEVGDGDPAVGSVLAFESGLLDAPFSINVNVKSKVLAAFDLEGIPRYVETGNLPLPKEVRDYHRQRLQKRSSAQNKKIGYEMVLEDLTSEAPAVRPRVKKGRDEIVSPGSPGSR